MPKADNIPPISINVEGLRRHSFLCIFISEPLLSTESRKLRSWLLHTVTTAARHYTKARELVILQDTANQAKDGGAIFYLLDVAEQIEGCVAATYRACNAIRRMSGTMVQAEKFVRDHESSIAGLSSIRNQFEHMHSQIVAGQTGTGPISMAFSGEASCIKFRNLKIETAHVHDIIEGAYRLVAEMFPAFDANSAPEAPGPLKLRIKATVTVTEGRMPQQDSGNSTSDAKP